MSASAAASREGPSKKISVASSAAQCASARRRAAARGGRKPANRNLSGGRPDRISAVSAAEGPGAAVTGRSSAIAARTSLKPGSDDQRRAGVADQRQRFAAAQRLEHRRADAVGIVVVIGVERLVDAETGQQPRGDPGILAQDAVDIAQHPERPQRDVAEIADRRRDEVKTRRQRMRRVSNPSGSPIGTRASVGAAHAAALRRLPVRLLRPGLLAASAMVRVAAAVASLGGGHPCCAGVFRVSSSTAGRFRPAARRSPPAAARMVPAPLGPPQPPYCRAEAAAAEARRNRCRRRAAGPSRSALLVPLSGPNAELGKAMLEAAQLALFATAGEKLTLMPRDTAGPGGAAGAARSAVADGATLFSGRCSPPRSRRSGRSRRGQGQRHRVLDADPGGRRQRVSDGVPAASGGGARGAFARERGLQPVRRAGAQLAVRPVMTDALREAVERRRRHGDEGRVPRPATAPMPGGDPPAARRRAGRFRRSGRAAPAAKAEFDALLLP